ncbi:hypothetical protein Misp03_85560 [Microbispora sp. NBRC 16548]|nr:hypothetical protein Misp03_85560 [Microbispora sp. NBRC 16548]
MAHRREGGGERHLGLIRNGENLYLMTTDLQVGDRPLPKREEFTEFFHTGEASAVTANGCLSTSARTRSPQACPGDC